MDEDGALNIFETSQAKTIPPTLGLLTFRSHDAMRQAFINRIHYRLNPTNAATYTLRLWRASVANAYELNLSMLYESPAAQADDTDYDRGELNIPVFLSTLGLIYYSIEWSAAPGNTTGFIDVSGEKVE